MEAQIDKSFDLKSLNKYNLSLKIGDDFFIIDVFKSKSGVHLAVSEQNFKKDTKDGFQKSNFVHALKNCPVKVSKNMKMFLSLLQVRPSQLRLKLFLMNNQFLIT
jgi:hypothetical protein